MALPVGQGQPTPAAVALALLDRVVAYYTEHAEDEVDPPVALPERRFVAAGDPRVVAWDVDAGQVHVSYATVTTARNPAAPPAPSRLPRKDPANAGLLVRSVTLEVQVVRPAPGLGQLRTLPSEDQLHRHGVAIGLDLHHLNRAIVEAARDDHLTRENVREAQIIVGDTTTLGPSGKLAAAAQTITVPLL